jgi:uncharacterized protein YodC (DUF2158 family)
MADFKLGDTVRLKSGGPIMTVTIVGQPLPDRPVYLTCAWFTKNEDEKVANFPFEALEHAEK